MTTLQPGQMLGPYQITNQIGKGGMATVYKAYQASMDRYVALKVVAGQLTDDPNFMQRFRQEARLIARLEHPHILPVYDFGEADDIPYMVMRFLDAGTLTERLDTGQLALTEIDRIFSQLADALEYAHENGVIHRDIKPSNAMLDKRGEVFLTDFGIAKMLEGSAGLTATGAITGTPAYMSPEQAQGQKVDQRSDIYSLGVVLFEMLTRRVPFEAETPLAVLFKQIQDPPPPLSLVRPDLPYTLEPVLLKALAKNPAGRYATMSDFRAGWKAALAEASTATSPSSTRNAQNAPPTSWPAIETAPPPAERTLQKPPDTTAPAKRPFNWKLLALGIPACLLVIACLAIAAYSGKLWIALQVTAGPTRVELVAAAPPAGKTLTAPLGKMRATSWAAANSVHSIAFRGDEVLAAGMGGVTIWKPGDGSYTRITTMDGLPGADAGPLLVDSDGSIWVGTDAGLVHIQGDQRAIYTSEQGLDSDTVTALARSGKRLFVGTLYSSAAGGGLLELNTVPAQAGQAWQKVPDFPSDGTPGAQAVSYNVHQIIIDKSGNLWVATDSGIAMLDTDKKWNVFKTASGLPADAIYTVYEDGAGTIWAGTSNGGAAKFNPAKRAFESFANLKDHNIYDVNSILQDRDGNLWFAGGDVARYNPAKKEWTQFSVDQGALPIRSVASTGMDAQGALYFGSEESGLARYANGTFKVFLVPNAPHYGQYGRILPAPDGKLLFVQLYENGADQFDPATGTWTEVPHERYTPLGFDAQGRMWSGGSEGLWIFDADKTTHVTTDHGLPSNQVNAIAFGADKKTTYIATGAGIAVFDGANVTDIYTAAKNGLLSDGVGVLFVASDGSLWVSYNGGFSRRPPDGNWQHFTADKLFGGYSQDFPAFVEDRAGTIWVATNGDGLYSFAQGKWKRTLSTDPGVDLPSDNFTSATLAPDGALWFGTGGQGAVRYDSQALRPGSPVPAVPAQAGQTWQRYRAEDGLINLKVNGIYVEAGGAIWFATNGGVTRLQP
jgi:ligand-binding sensor domain-containing protein